MTNDSQSAGEEPLVDEELADQLLAEAESEGVGLLGSDGCCRRSPRPCWSGPWMRNSPSILAMRSMIRPGGVRGTPANGTTSKRLLPEAGAVDLDVPRDRGGSFEPRIVRKGQSRLDGFHDRIIALCARGMTTRDIRAHLREIYDVEVSPDLISRVTDGVLDELTEWQSRPVDAVYRRVRSVLGVPTGGERSGPDPRAVPI